MISFLTFLSVLLIVFAGCARKDETPEPAAETEKVMAEMVIDPVCGMEIKKDGAIAVEHNGTTYYVCSNECKEQLLKDPDKSMKTEKVIDPVCGMNVSKSDEHMHTHHDETYYFCSPGCKEQFEKEPEKFLKTK